MLSSVVLPAPFGPITDRTAPGSTSRLRRVTAWTPPNVLDTSRISSSALIRRRGPLRPPPRPPPEPMAPAKPALERLPDPSSFFTHPARLVSCRLRRVSMPVSPAPTPPSPHIPLFPPPRAPTPRAGSAALRARATPTQPTGGGFGRGAEPPSEP